jgi:large subunit ribosomal protein L21
MTYAIIKLGGKQHRVREGERLLVDRVKDDEGSTLSLAPLLVGGNGDTQLTPDGVVVTARVVQHVLGEKIRIGKYKKRTGYRRHTGFRSRLTQIEIETIGGKAARERKPAAVAEQPAAEDKPTRAEKPKAATAAKPPAAKPAAKPKTAPKAAAEKPKPTRTTTKKDEG